VPKKVEFRYEIWNKKIQREIIKVFLEKHHPNIEEDQNFVLSKIGKMCQIASN
jgi:hypothetical protein